jgi:hypothetical protein
VEVADRLERSNARLDVSGVYDDVGIDDEFGDESGADVLEGETSMVMKRYC